MYERQRQTTVSCKGAARAVSRRGRLVRSLFFLALLLTLTACARGGVTPSAFGGGSGTESDPYLIATEAHLRDIAAAPHLYKGKHFLQTADIRLNGPWRPIGHSSYFRECEFAGRFDGNGHTITGLTLKTSPDYLGLFGIIRFDGEVRNLTVETSPEGISLDDDNYARAGIIAGCSDGVIENCITRGRLADGGFLGGIVAQNGGIVKNCINYAAIEAYSDNFALAGGIAGTNSGMRGPFNSRRDRRDPSPEAQISRCTNHGQVTSLAAFTASAGGITADNMWGTIEDSFNKGIVSAKGSSYHTFAGGVVGDNGASISRCLNTGAVSASGGISQVDGTRGPAFAGGLVGNNRGRIADSRSAVDATAKGGAPSAHGVVAGDTPGKVDNCGKLRQ